LLPNCVALASTASDDSGEDLQFWPDFPHYIVLHGTEQNGTRPIKKWAAAAAFAASLYYLLLSGSEVATQRSFFMTADRGDGRSPRHHLSEALQHHAWSRPV
jgi:hypothetical protein